MRRFIICAVLFSFSAFAAFAQPINTVSLFGDEVQPGNRLHDVVVRLMDKGSTVPLAISGAIDSSMTQEDTTLPPEAKSAIAFNMSLSNAFYREMVVLNSLIEVTKSLIEENPDSVIEVITLGIVLYPDFAQEVLDGATLSGSINPDDAFIAVLQAGADPSSISLSPARGPAPEPIEPVGAGIGSGGTGGGDTTASTN
ncbi:hypothetical protein [Glaciecola sp. 33A]|jgi:hypothetical protein|uniref:hypothetical protein n=1 Tax=Glaciecola sp. 33A TaxID=2057807 RepID=UPI000C34F526|nr:hypothetical protein [Glaciecola sp. 33A]PKI01717.1 hypothetical protein CXF81_09815 [Glaciecola sp. 33A]